MLYMNMIHNIINHNMGLNKINLSKNRTNPK